MAMLLQILMASLWWVLMGRKWQWHANHLFFPHFPTYWLYLFVYTREPNKMHVHILTSQCAAPVHDQRMFQTMLIAS